MMYLLRLSLLLLLGFQISCGIAYISTANISDLKASNISPSYALKDIEHIITLQYQEPNGALAISCSVTDLNNISVTTNCACTEVGVCTVGVTGSTSYVGAASFKYTVTSKDEKSEVGTADFIIKPPVPFVSTWRTTGPSETITLPLREGFRYQFTVDWGDGSPIETVSSSTDVNKTHTYASANDYVVTITGLMETLFFNNAGDKDKIIAVNDLGRTGLISLERAFTGSFSLLTFSGGDTSAVTNMAHMFGGVINITSPDLSSFDTSLVTNMEYMFASKVNLTSLDLTSFDTSLVTNMEYMFTSMITLTSLDLSTFDTSSVTNMSFMFMTVSSLPSIDLSNFNTSSVTNMDSMFFSTAALTSLDVSGFDTSSVTNMDNMFRDTFSLLSINTTGWNISSVTSATDIFKNPNFLLTVTCDQGGSPGTGIFFGKPCN